MYTVQICTIHAVFKGLKASCRVDPFLSQTRNLSTAPQLWVKSMPLQSYYDMLWHFNLSSFVSVETGQKRLTKNAIQRQKANAPRNGTVSLWRGCTSDINASFLPHNQRKVARWTSTRVKWEKWFLSACRRRQWQCLGDVTQKGFFEKHKHHSFNKSHVLLHSGWSN